jgi:hypothetical protein
MSWALASKSGSWLFEPIDAAVWFQVGSGQDAADGAAAHVAVVGRAEDLEGEVVEGPRRIGLLVFFGLAAGQVDDVHAFSGGKTSGAGHGNRRVKGTHPPEGNRHLKWTHPSRIRSNRAW